MGSVYLRGSTYWIKYYRGRTIRESAKTDNEKKALKLLDFREAQVKTGTFPGLRTERIKFDELAADYITDYKVNGRKSLQDAQIFVRHLSEHFGGMRVMDISTPTIQTFILAKQEAGYSNGAINRYLGALKKMLNLGARQTPPKVLRVPYIPMLKENNTRTGFFSHGEFLALRAALPDYLKPVVTVAYYTGFRRDEILSLKWEQVDMEKKFIILETGTTKNNEGRIVYMTDDLHRMLTAWKQEKDLTVPNFPLVCFRMENSMPLPVGEFRKTWKRACKAVGLEGRLLHDFRRTAVRNMVRAGIPERVAMRISGHKTRSIFDRYNIVNETDLKEAAGKLNDFQKSGHNLGTMEGLKAELAVFADSQLNDLSK